jgi:hypothetical protein
LNFVLKIFQISKVKNFFSTKYLFNNFFLWGASRPHPHLKFSKKKSRKKISACGALSCLLTFPAFVKKNGGGEKRRGNANVSSQRPTATQDFQLLTCLPSFKTFDVGKSQNEVSGVAPLALPPDQVPIDKKTIVKIFITYHILIQQTLAKKIIILLLAKFKVSGRRKAPLSFSCVEFLFEIFQIEKVRTFFFTYKFFCGALRAHTSTSRSQIFFSQKFLVMSSFPKKKSKNLQKKSPPAALVSAYLPFQPSSKR